MTFGFVFFIYHDSWAVTKNHTQGDAWDLFWEKIEPEGKIYYLNADNIFNN